MLLPAADELYDFQLGAGIEDCRRPTRLLDDAAVQFDRHPGGVEPQLLQESENGLPLRCGAYFAVYDNLNGHVRLTPLFCSNYSRI